MISREGDGGRGLAPVTYLPGAEPADHPAEPAPHQRADDQPVRWAIPLEPSADDAADAEASGSVEDDDLEVAAADDAEELLTRRLRRSALSEREARTFLAQRGTDPIVAEATVERFADRGWIDDAVLAEQLVYAGTSRKGQGRRAIAQTLSTRGIARDVADAALAALPDDDGDRALEYARSKAHGSGSVASNAARTALTEQRASGGVQFR
jgi:regulatory protein